jgi:NitT/TauT family transport system substrate-binding protein
MGSAPLTFAQELGFFDEEKQEISMVEFEGAATLLPQVASGRVTIGFPAPDVVIISRQPGKDPLPVRFFYNVARTNIYEFAVPEQSPIKSVKDLRGKKLGVGSLAFGNIPITRAVLKENGLSLGVDVDAIPVGVGPTAFRALTSGQIDALNLFDVQHAMLESTGTRLRRLPMTDEYTGLFANGYVAHNDTIRDHAPMLTGFGRAVAKGTYACFVNKRGCAESFWRKYPSQKPTGGTDESRIENAVRLLNARLNNLVDPTRPESQVFGEYSAGSWERLVKFLYNGEQLTTEKIDVSSLFTAALLKEINDFDRNEVAARARKVSN